MPVARLQEYLHRAAQGAYGSVAAGPFILYFHPTDALIYFNYGIPNEPAGGDLAEALSEVRSAFQARDRRARFEFIEEFAPDLGPSLKASGFEEEGRLHLMVATQETYTPAPSVDGLEIVMLTRESPAADLIAYRSVTRRGFGEEDTQPGGDDLDQMRQRLEADRGPLLARLNGAPAGVGAFTEPSSGMTEIGGIATLPELRRRGIAAAVTDTALREAFAWGVDLAMLTAADERAGRVYERIGFRPFATMLHYVDPA